MFGFSSASCYTCYYLDKNSVSSDRGWCNEKKKWVTLSGSACNNYEELFYVVTACSEIDNINNADIQKLLNFRNTYMCLNAEGIDFLNDYSIIGPIIVDRLYNDMYKSDVVKELKEEYIYPMIVFIDEGSNNLAFNTFSEMIDKLKIRYGFEPVKKEKTLVKF